MKKTLIGLSLMVIVIFAAIRITIVAQASGGDHSGSDVKVYTTAFSGDGTEANPWLISTADQLKQLANQVNSGNSFQNKYLALQNDIVLNAASSWIIIGQSAENSFRGTLDGGGHRISGLVLNNREAGKFQGLFGYNAGTIRSLRVESASVRLALPASGNQVYYAGIVAGCNSGIIRDTYSTAAITMTGKDIYAGGISGQNFGTIQSCYFNGSIATEAVSGTANGGGIAGSHSGTILNCYNIGSISASSYAGGIAGISFGGVIKNSYNSGTILFTANSGGICGANLLSAVTENCYYLDSCGGTRSGTALTADAMSKQSSFQGFDFTTIWVLPSALPQGYPNLAVFAVKPAADTIPVTPTGETAGNQPTISAFTDLQPSAWYYEAVIYCLQNGYMNGMSDTEFAPEGTNTRGMFVKMLANMAGINESEYGDASKFTDVATGEWYSAAVKWAAEKNIIHGMEAETFDYSASITYQQAVVMLYQYARLNGLDSGFNKDARLAFADGGLTAEWAEEAMDWAVTKGIFTGIGQMLEPQAAATRAHIAQLVYRCMK
ncbi:MAG TPA: S-layer homology domain-containing protein [Bacillota bacterium]|nr:S-layer homology domain-containing protein [Bacillota bacterium]